jgi:hypothetical protein
MRTRRGRKRRKWRGRKRGRRKEGTMTTTP